MDGAVFGGRYRRGGGERRVGTEEEVATGAAAGLGFREIGGVGVNFEAHATGVEANSGVGVGSGIVEEMGNGFSCGFGGSSRGNGAEGHQHGGVDGSRIVQEDTDNFLDSLPARGLQEIRGIFKFGELLFCSIVGGSELGWRIFGLVGGGVLEPVHRPFDVTGQ